MKSFPTPLALLTAATLSACPSRPPTPAPPAEATRLPPARVPEGCERDLSGRYAHAKHPDWTYVATDDGETLAIHVARAFDDGGTTGGADDGAKVVLHRTAEGFLGTTRAMAFAAQGIECEVDFPTELVGCPDGGLLLSTVESVSINEACVLAKVPPDAPREQHLLLPVGTQPAPVDAGASADAPR
ncbi:MAG: hypothetical protein WBV82_20150 [Myxococcaceae bacterium]